MQQLDPRHIGPGFGIGRYATVFLHRTGPGVVGGRGQGNVAVILLEQARQVFHPAEDILLGHQGIADPELAGGRRHQLGQPHGPLAGDGQRVEGGFGVDQRPDEGGFHLIGLGRRLYGAGIVVEEEACGAPVDPGGGIAGVAVVEQQQLVMTLLRHHVGIAHHTVLLHRLVDLDLARGGGRCGLCHLG
ncbi:hypothetical protein D3C80_1233950 [compost metagenome]